MTQDSLRSARHNQKSKSGKMKAVINTKVHASRHIESLKVEEEEKIDAPYDASMKRFNRMTNPNGHDPGPCQ